MGDKYKPGAVSSLIQHEKSAAEKTKEQKKLDKLFSFTPKPSSSSKSPQVAQKDVSTIQSPKKNKKSKLLAQLGAPVLDFLKERKSASKKDITKINFEKIKNAKNQIKAVKEKKRNSEDLNSPGRKKTKKFKEIATTTESVDDKQSIKKPKKAKKRKINSEEVAADEEPKNEGPEKKKKKLNKKKNTLTNGSSGSTEKAAVPKSKKKTLPVINDVLCALKESDGSKARKRTAPKEEKEEPEDERDQAHKRKKKSKQRDRTNDFRTVFVGNLPLDITKKGLMRLFSPCGEVENLRMRGAIPANPHRGKKYAILKKSYHSKCRSINAYVCFTEKESAKKACELLNGEEVEGQHIRVNSSVLDKTAHDHKRSVFVGNLPFAINEEDVRKHFLDCGEIANIRLVKDWKTGIGKGFGYVKFEEVDSADLAVKLDNSKLNNRKIRVHASEVDPKKRKADKTQGKDGKEGEKSKYKKSDGKDFVGMKAEKKKKKKNKPKHLARKMGLTTKKEDLPPPKPVEKVTGGPNKHMVFE